MAMPFRKYLALAAAALLLSGLAVTALAKKKTASSGTIDEQKRAVHALNRLTFGPRPDEVERVAQIGVDKWIELQLHPENIDDSALDARLAAFGTLRMDTRQIVENFPNNEIIKQVAEGKVPMPRDPVRRAVYQAQIQKYEDKQDRKPEPAPKSVSCGHVGRNGGGNWKRGAGRFERHARRCRLRAPARGHAGRQHQAH